MRFFIENKSLFNIPVPPPLPDNPPVVSDKTVQNFGDILKDIANVKLRKTETNEMKKRKKSKMSSPDIRHDLHAILVKRYSAMHSPIRNNRFSSCEEFEQSF